MQRMGRTTGGGADPAGPSLDCTSLTFMPPVKPILPSTTTILRWVRKLRSVGRNREMRSGLNQASSPPARAEEAVHRRVDFQLSRQGLSQQARHDLACWCTRTFCNCPHGGQQVIVDVECGSHGARSVASMQ